jgi:hypothetical protein
MLEVCLELGLPVAVLKRPPFMLRGISIDGNVR